MMNTTRIAIPVLLAAAVGLGASATAQDTPGKPVKGVPIPTTPAGAAPAAAPAAADTVDPKAKAIHDKGMDTLRKLKNVDMVSEISVTGVDPSMLPPGLGDKTRFVVDFEGAGGMMPFGRLAAERATDGKTSERFATDGKSALMVDEGKKSYMQGGPELMGAMGPRASTVQWLAMNRMMDPAAPEGEGMPKLVSCTVVGQEKLDGVDCDVVCAVRAMKFEGMEDEDGKPAPAKEARITETIAFARTDGLPRRVATKNEVPGEDMGNMVMTLTFTGVKADGTLDAKTFATSAPEGYKKAEMPAEDGDGPELKVKVGDAAPDFKLMDLAGKEVALGALKGKVVLLDFWATWCGPCKAAMPQIQKISEDYKGKDVVVLGVNTFERKDDAAKKYVESKGYTYGCLLKGDDLAKAYGITGIPTLVVIGKDGKIAMLEVGMGPDGADGIRKAIDAALSAK